MNKLLFNISFRVWHPTMPAADVISEFDLTPRFVHSIGEKRKTPKGTPLEGIYTETYCSFSLEQKTAGLLEKSIDRWGHYLEKHLFFLQEFSRTGGKLEFYVSIFLEGDGGFEIDKTALQRIQALGLGLSVEMYP